MEAIPAVVALALLRSIRLRTSGIQKFRLFFSVLSVSLVAFFPIEDIRAATIATGAGCILVDAIVSANTNAAVGGCTAGAAGQDTIVVNQNVVLTAVNNGSGSTANGLPVITEDLVIRSSAAGAMVTIERDRAVGTPEFRLPEIGGNAPSVTIRGLTLRFGYLLGSPPVAGVPVAAGGGCIKMGAGNLTIVDSLIEECQAVGASSATAAGGDASGGAIYAANGSLAIRNTTFSFNDAMGGEAKAAGFAGGKGEGGAISAASITLEMVDSTVVSSQALGGAGVDAAGIGKGGGMAIYNSQGTISGSHLLANASSGGLATNGSSALSVGGGLVVEWSTMTFDSTELGQNVASGKDSVNGIGGYAYGGGLYSNGSTLEFRDATVGDNRASGGNGSVGNSNGLARGGGLHFQDTTATIKRTAIAANSAIGARARGGGIYESNMDPSATPLEVNSSTLNGNVAQATFEASYGGGLYQDVGTTRVRRSTFSNNTADDGGAAAVESGTSTAAIAVDLANVTVSGNVANQHGGGLYVAGSPGDPNRATVSLYNTTVTNNTNDGIHLGHVATDPELVSANTIIGAQASGADCSVNGGATLTSRGGNLETGTSCAFTDATDQQSVPDLGLDVLADYGGNTSTHALLPIPPPSMPAGSELVTGKPTRGTSGDSRAFMTAMAMPPSIVTAVASSIRAC